MNLFQTLKTLSEAPGPSGDERAVAEVIEGLWAPYASQMTRDRVGNLMAIRQGQGEAPRPRLVLAAHMDEIALMVSQLVSHQDHGFLRVTNIGGVDRRQLYGQLVTVHGRRLLPAVLGGLPADMLPEQRRNQPYGYEDLVVDPGLPAATLADLVSVGDYVTFRQPLRKLQGKLVTGKALDNRASVAAVTACLDYLADRQHAWDVVAVATCQEETRLLGAYTSAFSQRPDAAVAIDVTHGKAAGISGEKVSELGGGPVLDIGPNVHPGMLAGLQEAARALEMKVQIGFHNRASGTDAHGLQVARAGIPTGLVSIPLRYMHTMVEVIDTADVERVGRLLGEFITRLAPDFVAQLAADMMGDEAE